MDFYGHLSEAAPASALDAFDQMTEAFGSGI